MNDALDAALASAIAVHPASWIARERFFAQLHERASGDAHRIAKLHAADLYLAVACADGVDAAIAFFERVHVPQVADFVARVDASPAFAEEVKQRLRVRLLVRANEAPRILTYSGAGSLGGWLRVCAVREARELAGRRAGERDLGDEAAAIDPELVFLKERYGALVSAAFKSALATLSTDERTMLRMHYIDGLTLEQLAAFFQTSRATGARALAKARASILDEVREQLKTTAGVDTTTADSLLAFVRSRIEIDLVEHLG